MSIDQKPTIVSQPEQTSSKLKPPKLTPFNHPTLIDLKLIIERIPEIFDERMETYLRDLAQLLNDTWRIFTVTMAHNKLSQYYPHVSSAGYSKQVYSCIDRVLGCTTFDIGDQNYCIIILYLNFINVMGLSYIQSLKTSTVEQRGTLLAKLVALITPICKSLRTECAALTHAYRDNECFMHRLRLTHEMFDAQVAKRFQKQSTEILQRKETSINKDA